MLENYNGYEWGWISKDGGIINPSEANVTGEVSGVWGKVYRTDISRAFYFETGREEGQALTELLRVNMQQCLLYAYPEDNPIPYRIIHVPEEAVRKTFKVLQRWRCKECEHTFYTDLLPKVTLKEIWKHIRALDFAGVTIECEICKRISCAKNGKKKMEVVS